MDTLVMDNKPDDTEHVQSYILIRFSGFGSALLDIQFTNVTAGQLFAASKTMEMQGEMQFIREHQAKLQQEAEQNIARPAQTILKPH